MSHERDALGLGQQAHAGENELVEDALGGSGPMLAQTLGHLGERTAGIHEDIGHGAREIGRAAVVTCLLPAVVKIAQAFLILYSIFVVHSILNHGGEPAVSVWRAFFMPVPLILYGGFAPPCRMLVHLLLSWIVECNGTGGTASFIP